MTPHALLREPRSLLRTTFLSAILAIAASGLGAQPVEKLETKIKLAKPARGVAAIEALGAHLPDVAKAHGLEALELATLFRVQPSLEVDIEGALLFACDFRVSNVQDMKSTGTVTPTTGDALSATSSTVQLASGSPVDAFQLHSFPGASRVIYLDFNGQTTSNTSWNSAYTGGAEIVSQPFDLDGDPTTFGATERAVIQGIWKKVAEDFAPFAVDVTTQDPGVEGLRKTASSDNAYGIRVVISPTNWYNAGAGGTAYIGSFNWSSDTPCWIFTQQLGNNEKYIGEVVSHEVGHTFGLYHDGVSGISATEYYAGHGNWAPIMGSGLYRSFTQFSKGEYANATNTQDDFAVMVAYAPVAADDHGGTFAAATVLMGPTLASGGTIETRSDVDVFRFDTGAGAIAINVASPVGEPDLHARVELLNSSGQIILSDESGSPFIALNVTVPAGTNFLRLSGIGEGDPVTTGYSDYGSLGNYVITGSLVAIEGKQAPVAKATASTTTGTPTLTVAFSGQNSTDSDGSIVSYNWDFGNGATSALMNPSYSYSTAGTFIAVLTVTDNDGLANSASVAITVTAPANVAPTAVVAASSTVGTAPLPIAFSSAGSIDPDGTISSYFWTFGDGTSSTVASPSKTYSTPGTYTAALKVTDNFGASSTASVAVSVINDGNSDIDVQEFTLSKSTTNAGIAAIAKIIVLNRAGKAVPGVTVSLQWSGLVSTKSSGKTDANGQVLLTSGRTKKAGTITGTVTSLAPPAGIMADSTLYGAPWSVSTLTK